MPPGLYVEIRFRILRTVHSESSDCKRKRNEDNAGRKKKNIYVAGGGPAGVEAAIVLAKRGHKVTVFEKTDRLGGMYGCAAVPPWKGEITSFIVWQRVQLEKRVSK